VIRKREDSSITPTLIDAWTGLLGLTLIRKREREPITPTLIDASSGLRANVG